MIGMNTNITMSVSGMTRTKEDKAVYVLFTDREKSAEIAIPGRRVISNKGFSDEEMKQLCFKIYQNIERVNRTAARPYDIRVSMGYAKATPDIQTIPDLIKEADRELYIQKRKRNVPMYQIFLKALKGYYTGLNLLNIIIN